MGLDKFFTEKAEKELRETESRKSQSLAQFREMINKHPYLNKVRQDDVHLLQFLRAKKFNMNDAFQVFEKYYLARKRYPQFFLPDSPNFDRAMDIFQSGYCYPLSERDEDGCRMIITHTTRLDLDKYTLYDGIRLGMFICGVLMEEEETQIAGIKWIYDHQDITTKHLMMPKDMLDFIDLVKSVSAGRQKGSFVLNLPPIAHFLLELATKAMTEKLRSRLILFHNWEELKASNKFNAKILPKEFGGEVPEAEMMKEFEKLAKEKRGILEYTQKLGELEWNRVPIEKLKSNQEGEVVGSFRKLEID